MHNIKLTLAYDGTRYLGWQKTRMGPSIEETLQGVLEQILQHPVPLQAASRTDAGVHANGQVVNFLTAKNSSKLLLSANALLPKDIVVLELEEQPLDFHPTLDAKGKEYHYYVCLGPIQMPAHRLYSWHVHVPLCLDRMRTALQAFLGEHDFSALCNAKKNATYAHYKRHIDSIEIEQLGPQRLRFVVKGNHFLYKMVRNLVGTLVYIGQGKMEPEIIPTLLASKQRIYAGITAPAHGLFLDKIFYDSGACLP